MLMHHHQMTTFPVGKSIECLVHRRKERAAQQAIRPGWRRTVPEAGAQQIGVRTCDKRGIQEYRPHSQRQFDQEAMPAMDIMSILQIVTRVPFDKSSLVKG